MTTIAPDQLPTPTTVAPAVPSVPATPFAHTVATQPAVAAPPARRAARRRLVVVGAAAALALAVGGLTLQQSFGGSVASADEHRDGSTGGSNGSSPDTTERSAGHDGWIDIPDEDPGIDLAGTYAALLGTPPDTATVDCLTAAVEGHEAEVGAVAWGTARSYDEVLAGVTPFAECAPSSDFDAALMASATQVFSGGQFEPNCAGSLVGSITVDDRVALLAAAVVDMAGFGQTLAALFGPCAI